MKEEKKLTKFLILGGLGEMYDEVPSKSFQITVYQKDYKTPDWFSDSVAYRDVRIAVRFNHRSAVTAFYPALFFKQGKIPSYCGTAEVQSFRQFFHRCELFLTEYLAYF